MEYIIDIIVVTAKDVGIGQIVLRHIQRGYVVVLVIIFVIDKDNTILVFQIFVHLMLISGDDYDLVYPRSLELFNLPVN